MHGAGVTPTSVLRERTAAAHAALENMRFGERLAAGTVHRVDYADYLRATATLVASMRTDLRRHGAPIHAPLLEPLEKWTGLLAEDLRQVGREDGIANSEAQQAALALVQKFRFHLVDDPGWVTGMAYVLFGSHNGNRSVADAVRQGLSLSGGAGTRYLRATARNRRLWPAFKDHVDDALSDGTLLEQAVAGALATFTGFQRIFETLEHAETRRPHASAVNPEAGDHVVVADGAFREIATKAGTLCHTAFGYLVRRYGHRGEAFARSDGAWLGTLIDLPEGEARRQLEWLARMLSARGIPSVCVEHHLDVLHQELESRELLSSAERKRFERWARELGSRHRAALDPDSYRRLADTPLPALDPRGADVLLCAVADQQNGLAPCADRLAQWIETGSGFERQVREQLRDFLHRARQAVAA